MTIIYSLVMDVYVSVVYQDLLDAAFVFDLELMQKYVIRLVIIVVSSCILCPLFSYIVHYCIQKTMSEVRVKVFEKVTKLSIPYYESTHSQAIISCLNGDIHLLDALYFWPVFRLLLVILIGGGSLLVLCYYSPAVAMSCVAIALITTLINMKYAKYMKKYADNIQELLAKIAGVAMDELGSYHVSRVYNIRSFLKKKYEAYNEEHYLSKIGVGKKEGELAGINNLLNYLGYIVICLICLYLMSQDRMTIGETIACIQLRGGIEFFVNEIGSIFGQIQFCTAGTERVFKILDQEEESESFVSINEQAKNLLQETEEALIRFENTSFAYDQRENILENINLVIEKGKRTAIIGESGSGKSTLTKLLLGFYNATEGEIYYNHKPLSQYTREEMREKIAYVPQEPTLFNDTIRNNIGLNVEDDSKIIEAAKAACIHDFIMSLPEQYNTRVGDNGARLSGGQKQRIAIARAFLKPSDVIIFDESTSAVEQELEGKIMHAIREVSEDKTIIFITHRLQILEMMDQVIKIDKHAVVDVTDNVLIDTGIVG